MSCPFAVRSVALACFAVVAAWNLSTAPRAEAQNPIIDTHYHGSVDYDPFHDHVTVVRNREFVRESALDPYRNHIDPGSFVRVDRTFRDSQGRLVREFGTKWTSYGVPHGNLTRQVVTHQIHRPTGPSVEFHDHDNVVYSRPVPYYRPRPQQVVVSYPPTSSTVISNTGVAYSMGGNSTGGHNHGHGNHGHVGHNHGPSSSTTINTTTTYRSLRPNR